MMEKLHLETSTTQSNSTPTTHPKFMNTRNGKIARLPEEIREELNERLEAGEPGPKLLAWLNALKRVQKILKQQFDGAPITKQNLSEWRQGGHQEWLVQRDFWGRIREVKELANQLEANRDNVVADDVATVLAAQYAVLLSKWDGEPDAKFAAKARTLNGLVRAVMQLQRGMHRAKAENDGYIRQLEEDYQKQRKEMKEKQLNQVFSMLREPRLAKIFGGGEIGEKLAHYVVQVENDVPGAKLEMPTKEEMEKERKEPEPEETLASPPKEKTKKKIKSRKPRGAKAPAESKPLEGNDMNSNQPDSTEPSNPPLSEPVQPNQTSFLEENSALQEETPPSCVLDIPGGNGDSPLVESQTCQD